MANFSLVTVKKGNITTVDGFIKTFNTIGHNMKALAVSAYGFLTSEDKELSIEFGKRVRDELNMSKATLSNLRTAGWLYTLSDVFEKFSYTNVVLFKKNVEELKDENGVIDMAVLNKFIEELALSSNSKLTHDIDNYVNYLSGLSQKDLKHIIEVYNTPIAEATVEDVTEDTEEAVEEDTEEAVEETEEAVEEAKFYNIIDDDFVEIMHDLTVMINEKSLSKKEVVEYATLVYNRLLQYAE